MTTIGQWFAQVADLPRLDCELLLAHTLDVNRAYLLAFPEQEIHTKQQEQLAHLEQALRAGKPTAYLLGEWEFWGLPFKLNEHTLIPRPETELLVEVCLDRCPTQGTVLDLGTGSGAIAIAVAHSRPDLQVSASDISEQALAMARENALFNQAQVNFQRSSWLDDLEGQWHMILSNPPYIAPNDPHLPALKFEPRTALVAQDNGLGAIRQIISQSTRHLTQHGTLAIEHGYDQAAQVRAAFAAQGYTNVESLTDLAGIQRVTLGCWA